MNAFIDTVTTKVGTKDKPTENFRITKSSSAREDEEAVEPSDMSCDDVFDLKSSNEISG